MIVLLIVGLIMVVLGVKGWKRAMHRRLINQRLNDWCRRYLSVSVTPRLTDWQPMYVAWRLSLPRRAEQVST